MFLLLVQVDSLWLEEDWLGNWMEGSGGWNGAHMDVKEECACSPVNHCCYNSGCVACPSTFYLFHSAGSEGSKYLSCQVGADSAQVALVLGGGGCNFADGI